MVETLRKVKNLMITKKDKESTEVFAFIAGRNHLRSTEDIKSIKEFSIESFHKEIVNYPAAILLPDIDESDSEDLVDEFFTAFEKEVEIDRQADPSLQFFNHPIFGPVIEEDTEHLSHF